MLSDSEIRFIAWWEENRNKEKRLFKQLLVGLPLGILFGVPIFINFFSGWYKRAEMIRNTRMITRDFNPIVLMFAVLLIIFFVAIFSKRHKWEMNEQKYQELKLKGEDNEPAILM